MFESCRVYHNLESCHERCSFVAAFFDCSDRLSGLIEGSLASFYAVLCPTAPLNVESKDLEEISKQ